MCACYAVACASLCVLSARNLACSFVRSCGICSHTIATLRSAHTPHNTQHTPAVPSLPRRAVLSRQSAAEGGGRCARQGEGSLRVCVCDDVGAVVVRDVCCVV